MIDLHTHLIPGVDDGSRSVAQSVSVLQRMQERGVTDVCLTPHLKASRAEQGIPSAHDSAFAQLEASAPKGIKLHRGVELMLDRPFPVGAAGDGRLRLGRTRYILVEFMTGVAPPAALNALTQVVQFGLIPVLAHPERYRCCTPAVVSHWKSTGALMQVDGTTLFMPRSRGERARALIAAGLADIVASDNHGDDRVLTECFVRLSENDGHEQAELLARGNPAAILADIHTSAVPPLTIKQSLLRRIRHLFNTEE